MPLASIDKVGFRIASCILLPCLLLPRKIGSTFLHGLSYYAEELAVIQQETHIGKPSKSTLCQDLHHDDHFPLCISTRRRRALVTTPHPYRYGTYYMSGRCGIAQSILHCTDNLCDAFVVVKLVPRRRRCRVLGVRIRRIQRSWMQWNNRRFVRKMLPHS